MPSQSAIRARTPGAAASVAAATATTTSAAIAAVRARGPASHSRTRGAAAVHGRPPSWPAGSGSAAIRAADGAGEVGRRRPGDLVAQQGELPLEVGHGATTSPARPRSSSARIRPSARDSRDLPCPAGNRGPPPSRARRGRAGGGRRSPRGRARRARRGPPATAAALAAGEQRGLGGRSRVPRDPLLRRAEREARAAPAARRRLRASLATIASSHGRNGAPARKRGSARHAFTKASCAASSASAADPANRQAVRKAMSWCARTSAS